MNKSQLSESNILASNSKNKDPKSRTTKLCMDIPNLMAKEISSEINLFNVEPELTSTMKKTLEANNREMEIPEESKNSGLNSTKKSQIEDQSKLLSKSLKLAAYRASELKKRNKTLIKRYGGGNRFYNDRQERDFIKMIHSAAITIQNCWRDYILDKKSQNKTIEKIEYIQLNRYQRKSNQRSNSRSTSNHGCSVPKLDLSGVASKKDLETSNQNGVFHQSSKIDLSSKRLQNIMMSSDLTSMIKVREDALDYKYKKEKSNIQSLLSSQKISPRTGGYKELELEKWVYKEREDIDKTKKMYEENKRKTEQILKETMGIDNAFADFDSTQKTLKKLFSEKVNTPREGLSLRSGFSSSRRKFEQDKLELNNGDEEVKEKHFEEEEKIPQETPPPTKHQKSQKEETKDNLQKQIESKLKANQEITFGEKDKEDSLFGDESSNGNGFSELKAAFQDNKIAKSPEARKPKPESDSESPLGAIDSEPLNRIGMRTQNIFQSLDDEAPDTGRRISSDEKKDPSKSLDSCQEYKRQKDSEELKDGNNMEESSQSCSLPRIKSEHVLGFGGDSSDQKPLNEEEKDRKDKKNQDALEKLEGVKNFNQPSPSPERVPKTNQEEDETLEPLNVELSKEETISLEDGFGLDGKKPFGIDLGQTLDRSTEGQMKAVLESANDDYKNLVKSHIIGGNQPSSAILVSDDGEIGDYPGKPENGEESSPSDLHDISKSSEFKKDTFTKVQTKFDKLKENKEEIKDDSSDVNMNSDSKKSNHSRSFEDLADVDNIEEPGKPISSISIERIGSPNKPKQVDERQKLDDDEEEDIEIITGSHSISNINRPEPDSTTVIDIYRKLDSVQHSDTSNDLGLVINDLCEKVIKDLDKELFPQRPLFFMTTDMTSITLEQATTLLQQITPEKEKMLVQQILEGQIGDPAPAAKASKPKRKSKGSKDKKGSNKIVLYEKKGIRTDLVAVEHYVDALHKHIDKNKRNKFLKNLFSSMKHDPFKQLNQLQNSDIGS